MGEEYGKAELHQCLAFLLAFETAASRKWDDLKAIAHRAAHGLIVASRT
jgi:hypothetical protein